MQFLANSRRLCHGLALVLLWLPFSLANTSTCTPVVILKGSPDVCSPQEWALIQLVLPYDTDTSLAELGRRHRQLRCCKYCHYGGCVGSGLFAPTLFDIPPSNNSTAAQPVLANATNTIVPAPAAAIGSSTNTSSTTTVLPLPSNPPKGGSKGNPKVRTRRTRRALEEQHDSNEAIFTHQLEQLLPQLSTSCRALFASDAAEDADTAATDHDVYPRFGCI